MLQVHPVQHYLLMSQDMFAESQRDFSVVQSGFISYLQISDENKTIGLIRLLNVSMSVSCEIKLHVESLYILWDALIPFLARSSIADLNFPLSLTRFPYIYSV